ncbi:MAG: metallophosphoesterase family protein [bacterium]
MRSVKFIHTGDLHLDTPFRGLSSINKELAHRLKDATLASFRRIIDECIRQRIDFLLVTGDIFDSQVQSLAAQLLFVEELKRLGREDIPAYIITGNHDPLQSWIKELEMPQKVFRFGGSQVESFRFEKEGQPLADIYGISYESKVVNRNLAAGFHRRQDPAPFSIALLHGTIGSSGPHENYAPFRLDDVKSRGFDYWALGHIHKRHLVHPAFPAILYPGNPQGRDFGETGQRGCYLVEMQSQLPPELTFIPTQSIRFELITANLDGLDNINALGDRIEDTMSSEKDHEDGTSFIYRLQLTGRTPLHALLHRPGEAEEVRNKLNEGQLQQTHFRWIDRIELQTRPEADLEELKKASDFPAEVIRAFDQLQDDPAMLDEWLARCEQDFNSQAARRELDELSAEDKAGILDNARWILLDQLLNPES